MCCKPFVRLLGALLLSGISLVSGGGCAPLQGSSYELDMITGSVDSAIQRELGGGIPLPGQPTWRAYWQVRYHTLRSQAARGYSPQNCQRAIAYIHEQRRRFGLPLYDPEL